MFKFIPYLHLKFKLSISDKDEVATLIEQFLKTDLPRSTMILFTNPKRPYVGDINKAKQTFSIKKSYGQSKTDLLVSFMGKYYTKSDAGYIEIKLRPSLFLFILPAVTYLFNGLRDPYSFLTGIIGLVIWHFIFFVLPFNSIGNGIGVSFHKHISKFIVEEIDLSAKYLRF